MLARSTVAALMLAVTQLVATACTRAPAPTETAPSVDAAVGDRAEAPVVVARAASLDEDGSPPVRGGEAEPCDGEVDVDGMSKRADAYFATGDKSGGIACLEEAVAGDPQNTSVRNKLIARYLDANEGTKALVYAQELVRQKPLDSSARETLGRAYMQQRMWKEAIDAFDLVVKAKPDDVYANNNIGFSALQIGRLDVAREHLEHVLSLAGQKGYMLNNLGVTYERLDRMAEAHAAYSRATELSPAYARARLNRDRVQALLSQDERITSTETLLRMREEPVVAALAAPSVASAPADEAVAAAVEAATGTGGSARMAPAPSAE